MKILIITGQLAENIISKNISQYQKHELYLKVIPMPIAAFITPKLISYHLKQKNILKSINTNKTCPVDNIDMIITPGLIKHDTKEIQKELNIPSYKGPSNAADILMTLDIVDNMKLSTTTPADVLIRDQQYQQAMNLINNYKEDDQKICQLLQKDCNILINDCPVGEDFPMRVLGEIANASQYTQDQLLEKVEYYISSGADMIDIGMNVGENNPDQAYSMVKLVKDNFDITVSIDTLHPSEIKKALDAEADLVLSVDEGNYCKVINDIHDHNTTAVIIPTNYAKNIIPKTPEQKIMMLERLDKKCENIQTIADLLLDPINSPSLTEAIVSYHMYRKRNPTKQLFFGVGNVSELLDADSNGVNAVLSGIASELGVSILFTPEASLKTKNSIKELKTASNMMFIAKMKNSIPKNVGINLIQLKDAYKKEDVEINTDNIPVIDAVADGKFTPDTKGSFKIIVEDNLIKTIYYRDYVKESVITSTSARAIYEEILRRDMISRIEHAAYLGMELEKAEIALKLNKKYIQDFPIF